MYPLDRLAEQGAALLDGYTGRALLSLECGRGLLDRGVDPDQEAGVAIGAAVLGRLAAEQPTAPWLTPLIEDDPVLLRLRPSDCLAYLRERLPVRPLAPVPVSSPVLRAVVAVLYGRLHELGLAGRLRQNGGSLFVTLADGSSCELLEDVSGARITGGVFLEAALLVYRCAPAGFDRYFQERFGPDGDVHRTAAGILDLDCPHAEKTRRLRLYYRQFAAVTDLGRPDDGVRALVAQVLAGGRTAHLNILPDYYGVQQHKARALLELLRLPLELVSLHVNAAGGRVALAR